MLQRYCTVFFSFLVLGMCGCAPLMRGMDGNTYVSTAKPAIAISVPALPLRTAGQILPAVTTNESLGGVTVEAWIAIYGGRTPEEPMAIVSQAVAPPHMYWDSDTIRSFSVDHGMAVFDDQGYQACTFIVNGSGDAFSLLVKAPDPNALQWIVRRFALRTDFNEGKITLEYRELLPAGFGSLTNLPQGGRTFLDAFNQRAEKAFVVNALKDTKVQVRTGFPAEIQLRYLNTNFFGTMSRYQAID